MPCYRCGTRQVDPDRCASPWLRGVRADRQVLICPGCQSNGAWITELDRCSVCTSTRLVRRLGEVECRDCGAVGAGAVGAGAGLAAEAAGVAGVAEVAGVSAASADGSPPGLSEEVEQALVRVLRHSRASYTPAN